MEVWRMIAELVVAFLSGAAGHKLWRAWWRTRRGPVSLRNAIADEFAPPSPEDVDRKRERTPRVSEVA